MTAQGRLDRDQVFPEAEDGFADPVCSPKEELEAISGWAQTRCAEARRRWLRRYEIELDTAIAEIVRSDMEAPATPEVAERVLSIRARLAVVAYAALATAGIVMLLEVAVTLLWQEPLSYVYAARQQDGLERELDDNWSAHLAPTAISHQPKRAPGNASLRSTRQLARSLALGAKPGDAIGKLQIPSVGLDQVMVQGTDDSSLAQGPGHYADTQLPGQGGTTGIAGHRTTYSAPFRDIEQLGPGTDIVVAMPYARFTYRLIRTEVVSPEEVSVLGRGESERLVLTSCHPEFSDAERIVAFARLDGVDRRRTGSG